MAQRWITDKARQDIFSRDKYTCCYCGCTVVEGDTRYTDDCSKIATLDHIIPQEELKIVANGDKKLFGILRRDAKNLVTVCMSCNASKRNIPLFVWCNKKGLNYYRIIIEIAKRVNTAI